jgi:hypothetical protein
MCCNSRLASERGKMKTINSLKSLEIGILALGSVWMLMGRAAAEAQVPNVRFSALLFSDAKTGTVVGYSGYHDSCGIILRTTDGGATWRAQFLELPL